MEGLLRVNNQGTVSAYMGDDTTSTCALITPSPPTNALVNPLPEAEEKSEFVDADELVHKLKHVKTDSNSSLNKNKSDSSSNSSLAEPSSATLLNYYPHLPKNEETVTQEAPGKVQPLQMTFKNPPENFFFMKWNWNLIRKISAWIFLALMVAMLGIVIAMVWNLPKKCNPITPWYRGNVMYEIFPANVQDSNHDGIGDFKGVISWKNYFHSLNIRSIRFNSIFKSQDYPEDYKNVTSLTEIAHQLGSEEEFRLMVMELHEMNISVVLDLPLYPFIKKLEVTLEYNSTSETDSVAKIIKFWTDNGVDGFYLEGVQHFAQDNNFPACLRRWKKIVGPQGALIVDDILLNTTSENVLNTIYANVDLIKVSIPIERRPPKLKQFFTDIFNSSLFTQGSMPWILWTVSDEWSLRIADRLPHYNSTAGLILLQLMLPGTPCIYYGDETGMKRVVDFSNDGEKVKNTNQLGPMMKKESEKQFTPKHVHAWNYGVKTQADFDQIELISQAIKLRTESPSLYVNSFDKDGMHKVNAEIKYADDEILVLQRWYPRRKSYVILSKFGLTRSKTDLSKLLYAGNIIIGPKTKSKPETISFSNILLDPGDSVVLFVS